MLPDVLIVGAQKAGTKATASNLSLHSDIIFGDEFHFFDRHWENGVDWYKKRIFDIKSKKPQATFIGERTPAYICFEKHFVRIKETIPEVKMIVLLRNPTKRAISQNNMYWKRVCRDNGKVDENGVPNELCDPVDFHRRFEWSLKNLSPWIWRGNYHKQLIDGYKHFPKEQFHIGVTEKIISDTDGEYNKMFRFIGIEPKRFEYKANPTQQLLFPLPKTLDMLDEYYRPHNERLFDLLGYEIPEWQ